MKTIERFIPGLALMVVFVLFTPPDSAQTVSFDGRRRFPPEHRPPP